MHTFFHAMAQGANRPLGVSLGFIGLLLLGVLVKRLLSNPFKAFTAKQQQRLFRAYWRKLERQQQYEQLEALRPVLDAYLHGGKPSSKLLKPYTVVSKTTLKTVGVGLKLRTTRRIVRKDDA